MDAEIWRWIWLVAAATFAMGEMALAGTFFLFPFAIGATLAAIVSFLGAGVGLSWGAFVVGSGASFAALRPLVRRFDKDEPVDGIGARRLIGQAGVVLEDIPAGGDLGLIRVNREQWRAESADARAIPAGVPVKIIEIRGTRAVVWPTSELDPTGKWLMTALMYVGRVGPLTLALAVGERVGSRSYRYPEGRMAVG